jgi:ComF family protein
VQRLGHQPCVLCGERACGALCAACDRSLPLLPGQRCAVCATPLESGRVCGACLARPPRYEGVSAALVYDFPADALVQAYKYGGELRLARAFGEMLARRVPGDVDLVVPMPLSVERLRSRGYNQAQELARHVTRAHGLALDTHACRRVTDGMPQAQLPWRERARNIRGAFVCDSDLEGLRVAVVDDVLTTGATLNELARNLKRAGAAAVYGWVVARAVPRLYRRRDAALD